MSDKPSPSSASTVSGVIAATPQSTNSLSLQSRVVVTKQPPTHLFAEEWFEVEFDFEAAKGKRSAEIVECVVALCHQKTNEPVGDDVPFSVLPSALVSFSPKDASPRRKRMLRCRIALKEVGRENPAAFFIKLSPNTSPGADEILSTSTHQIRVVNYKISVSLSEGWEHVWYKDEGGRDKCMVVQADVLSKDGDPYVGEQIPLQLTLCYDTGEQPTKVSKQDILRVLGSSKTCTDKKTGKAALRFRIDDVSKNHQGQDFRVEVAVDVKAKGFHDIAPGYTPPVSVRSKRNKRQRLASSEQTQYTSPARAKSVHGVAGKPTARGSVSAPEDQMRMGETPFSGVDSLGLREAVKGVIQWTEDVVNGLHVHQWQLIGYAHNPDGTPDFSRPYHTMQNPNDFVQRVLTIYSEATRGHLQFLANSVDRLGASHPSDMVGLTLPLLGLPASGGSFTPINPRVGTRGMHMPMHMRTPLPRGSFMQGQPRVPMALDVAGFPSQAAFGGGQLPMQSLGPMGTQIGEMGALPMEGLPSSSLPQASRFVKGGSADRAQQQEGLGFGEANRESEVAYVLAKQFKAMRTGDRLGFPAYSDSKELLGFYRESGMKVGVGQFIPISHHREDFGPMDIMQATHILFEAIENKSEAVYALKDWGSISNLIDHALVYDWSKDIGSGTNNSGTSSSASGD